MSVVEQTYKYSPHLTVADGGTLLAGFAHALEVAAGDTATLTPPAVPALPTGASYFSVINTGPGTVTITGLGDIVGIGIKQFVADGTDAAWVELPQAGGTSKAYPFGDGAATSYTVDISADYPIGTPVVVQVYDSTGNLEAVDVSIDPATHIVTVSGYPTAPAANSKQLVVTTGGGGSGLGIATPSTPEVYIADGDNVVPPLPATPAIWIQDLAGEHHIYSNRGGAWTMEVVNQGHDFALTTTFFGQNAALSNTGNIVTAVGLQAARNNTGNFVTALGENAANQSTGNFVTAVGYNAAQGNTGAAVTALGHSAAESNTRDNVTAIGNNSAQLNTGIQVTAVGAGAALNNTGDNVTIVGNYPGNAVKDDNAIYLADGQGNLGLEINSPDLTKGGSPRSVKISGDTFRINGSRTITTSTDPGHFGEICCDENYIYFCVAEDIWKRAPLSTW